jgi:hypothetical protein
MAALNDPKRILTVIAHQYTIKHLSDYIERREGSYSDRQVVRMLMIHGYLSVDDKGLIQLGGECYLSREVGYVPELLSEPTEMTKMLSDLNTSQKGEGLFEDYSPLAVEEAIIGGYVHLVDDCPADGNDRVLVKLTEKGRVFINQVIDMANFGYPKPKKREDDEFGRLEKIWLEDNKVIVQVESEFEVHGGLGKGYYAKTGRNVALIPVNNVLPPGWEISTDRGEIEFAIRCAQTEETMKRR